MFVTSPFMAQIDAVSFLVMISRQYVFFLEYIHVIAQLLTLLFLKVK